MPQRTEVKYFDVDFSSATITSTGSITKLCAITQGTAVSQRVGDEILAKRVSIRLHASQPAATAAANCFRIIVFQWLMSDSVVAPSLLGVLKNSGFATEYPSQPYNIQNVEQQVFSVVWDEMVALDNVSRTSYCVTKELNLNSAVRFDAAAVTGQGCFYMLLVTSQATNGVNARWNSRLLYTDS